MRSSLWLLAVLALGCSPDDSELSRQHDVLDQSEAAWEALESAQGSTYWFTETKCGQVRDTTHVAVTDGVALIVSREESEEGSPCAEGEPYRYEDFGPAAIPDLYDECRAMLSQEYDTTIGLDAEGVIKFCRGVEGSSCRDACDHGFHIASRGFGA
jgi:hypothetical protein